MAKAGHRSEHTTLVDHYRAVFLENPQDRTYRFLPDGEGDPVCLTNAELDQRARALAVLLRERVGAGERALIVCPPGLDYVVSYYACLYAGVIAVPVYPPDPTLLKRTLPRLIGVVEDARPKAVLAPASVTAMADEFAVHVPSFAELLWVSVDRIDLAAADSWQRPDITGDSLAFLQYTSGSTSRPKGVMVGHANLVHNLAALNRRFFDATPDDHLVIWLPPYHDMGLIAGLLSPAFGNYPVTFMPPFAFLKRPLRWLEAISAAGGTLSGAPNFAYDLCVAKSTEEERAALDLSNWRVTLNGAEPVRVESMDRFARAFAPSGFRRQAFMPSYGLAEATLAVTGGQLDGQPVVRRLQAAALAEQGIAVDAADGEEFRTGIGCGWSLEDQQLAIVDPVTRRRLPEGRVGEIWLAGPSMAHGYWERPQETETIFRATVDGTGEGPFLRTGDLGFLDGSELYVAGRAKDLIIIDGLNHYPQDIERSIESVDPALRPGCGIAGTREIDGVERLIIVHEVGGRPQDLDAESIFAAVRARVAEVHGIPVHAITLVRRGGVPKTSSGKLQRSLCLDTFLAGGLPALAAWTADGGTPAAAAGPAAEEVPAPDAREIEAWLIERLARTLGQDPAGIDPTAPIAGLGMRSVDLVSLIGELERHLDRTLSATLAWAYPTVEALAAHLAGAGPAPAEAPQAPEEPAEPAALPAFLTPAATAEYAAEPMAVVGIGCRFPGGANGPEGFWQLLTEGRDAVTEVPEDRWKLADYATDDPAEPGRTTSRWGGFLDDVHGFDAQFFGISSAEAARMDPQQRLLAEVAWEALEDAGLPAEQLAGTATGVFVGISSFDHGVQNFHEIEKIDAYTGTGSALSIAANRLSYLFDLRGPSMAVDTACSSSLVAVHQAAAALASGECTLALAAGVNLILSPALAVNFSKAGAMASDGHCKAFDARADGYVRAEGCGVVVLKPLGRALADKDRIYAVVRGSAVNQDGRSNGIMAPNPLAQEEVLRAAYDTARVRPDQVQYVEAHGTGTLLGDPIEARALSAVLCADRAPEQPMLIGSVKSNLGHMEAAAGIGGLIKAALALSHRSIPASLHFETPNPHIPFRELALRVVDRAQPWPVTAGPALAGVSSFGFGGTNAHVVLEEGPRTRPAAPAAGDAAVQPLLLSARDPQALAELAGRYRELLERPDGAPLTATAATAALRRTQHPEHRLAVLGSTAEEWRAGLAAFLAGEEHPALVHGSRVLGRTSRTAFVFCGQGPRWWPVAADLMDEPVFRSVLERCEELLRPHTNWSLLAQLAADQQGSRLTDTAVGQPALCAVQIALAAQWQAWGVLPDTVVGHSVGEIAAAHVAGALTLQEALLVALHRGRVLHSAVGRGRMAVVGVGFDEAERLVAGSGLARVWVAGANGPQSAVLSGDGAEIEELAARLTADGLFCRVLESVEFPSHCPLMDRPADDLRRILDGLAPRPTTVPFLSTVHGRVLDGAELDAAYWGANLRSPVLFDQAVSALVESGHDAFVEIGPHPTLLGPIADRLGADGAEGVAVGSLRRDEPGRPALLAALSRLHCAGRPVDWSLLLPADGPNLALPSYPWQHQHSRPADGPALRRRTAGGHPLRETALRSAVEPRTLHWSAAVDRAGFGWLADHQVGGTAVLPAALLLDAALAAAREALGEQRVTLENVALTAMNVLPDQAADATWQLVLQPGAGKAGSFRQLSAPAGAAAADGGWTEAAAGRYRAADGAAPASVDLDDLRARCAEPVGTEGFYRALERAGIHYGPAFQGVRTLRRGAGEALAELRDAAELTGENAAHLVHPAVLDSCLQALAAALDGTLDGTATHLPVGVGSFTLHTARAVPAWAHAVRGTAEPDGFAGCRVELLAADGAVLGTLDGITLQRLGGAADTEPGAEALLDLVWQPADAPAPAEDVEPDGWWLLLADRDGTADALAAELRSRGARVVTATAGEQAERLGPDAHRLPPLAPDALPGLLAELRDSRPGSCLGVLSAWALDAPEPEADGGEHLLWTGRDAATAAALHAVQALAGAGFAAPPRLALLTRGAQRVPGDEADVALAQAPLWGLARVAVLEHAELRPLVVDLDPATAPGSAVEAALLADRLLAESGPNQLAVRGGTCLTPRLEPRRAVDGGAWPRRRYDRARDTNLRVLAERPGILESLVPTVWRRTAPGPGQVEIEVAAAGLNFNDLLKAMGDCPGVPNGVVPLGGECAGRVVAVGEGVDDLRVGDPVMAVAGSTMAEFTTTGRHLVAPRPEGLTDEQAAGVPIAFLTAVYGLEYLGRLAPGETVLIHSAAGGVGLAAIQVARRCGAEVFATAGTEEKRELLRSLGVAHVLDSRSLEFADRIAAATGGRGVDVVLNSLAGEAFARSMELLAPGGRFVEIGKRDVYGDTPLGMRLLRDNRSFAAVDLEYSFAEQPALVRHLFAEVAEGFARGEFGALPVTAFGYGEAAEAFSFMAKARHTGKIVLRPDERPEVAVRADLPPVGPGASYLVTGGLGGLGLATARYLADQGARHLVLVGRSAPSAEAEAAITELRERGVSVLVRPVDVSRRAELDALLAEVDAELPPLGGVVHTAGVLDDGLLPQLDQQRFQAVARPKAAGAWHLHEATRERELDFFVLYSSAAALLGSASQANYAAANAFLDGLALHRRARGLPALSIAWGPWSEVGLAARPDRGGALSTRGVLSLSPADGIAAFDRLMRTTDPLACVLPLDRERLAESAAGGLLPALLLDLVTDRAGAATGAGARQASGELRGRLLAVEPGRRRRTLLVRHCVEQAAKVLGLEQSLVDPAAPLVGLGFDSLMSLELRKRLEASTGTGLPATLTWRFPSIEVMVPFLAEQMEIALEAAAGQPAPAAAESVAEAELDELSTEDLEALLAAKSAQFEQIHEGR
ncbi:SDR family NAD(P)-dependent oxidoreductase [Kitasatospora sp. NPDC092948]|uniref:SDR family NAD(P)-dependent oxidoreductase n=1 Tax=Kitasatospora sp. NPDC092948 TaxID=3364088 RepID=UPI00381D9943